MKTEIVILIVTSIVTLITVIANIIVTAIIAVKQNKIELKKTRIDVLEARRGILEKTKADISNRIIDVSSDNIADIKILLPKIVNYFQQNASAVSSIGHYLNPEFISKVEELTKRINYYIINDKTGQPSDETQKKKDIKLLSEINEEIKNELSIVLRKIETDIEKLMGN